MEAKTTPLYNISIYIEYVCFGRMEKKLIKNSCFSFRSFVSFVRRSLTKINIDFFPYRAC